MKTQNCAFISLVLKEISDEREFPNGSRQDAIQNIQVLDYD